MEEASKPLDQSAYYRHPTLNELHGMDNHKDLAEAQAIMMTLFASMISVQLAAEKLASLSLKDNNFEDSVLMDWYILIGPAEKSTDQHQTLSELLIAMMNLPPPKDDQGNQLKLGKARFWDDLPALYWNLYDEWNAYQNLSDKDWSREEIIARFVNLNKFAARLKSTQYSIFDAFNWWALVVMREALEYLEPKPESEPPELFIPAAVAWVSMLGPEVYSWDKEFPLGDTIGDPGKGGPLWNGQHGFCKERWNLWKHRFIELSSSSELSEELKKQASEGAAKMDETETQVA